MKTNAVRHIIIFLTVVTMISCEKWYVTEDVSHVSYLPEFTLIGGEFMSLEVTESGEFEDPGVIATVDGEQVQVYYSGGVDLTEVGLYIITYYAANSDALYKTAQRYVAVTNGDVSDNDYSGTYIGTLWSPQVESKVKKIDEKGLYKCEDVMGYPGFEMPGRFVDLGDGEIVLLPGEGYFGSYDASEGIATRSTLSWTIYLLDEPYDGIDISVTWTKTD